MLLVMALWAPAKAEPDCAHANGTISTKEDCKCGEQTVCSYIMYPYCCTKAGKCDVSGLDVDGDGKLDGENDVKEACHREAVRGVVDASVVMRFSHLPRKLGGRQEELVPGQDNLPAFRTLASTVMGAEVTELHFVSLFADHTTKGMTNGDAKPHAVFTANLARMLDASLTHKNDPVAIKVSYAAPCKASPFYRCNDHLKRLHNLKAHVPNIELNVYQGSSVTGFAGRPPTGFDSDKGRCNNAYTGGKLLNWAAGTAGGTAIKTRTNRVICIGGATEYKHSPEPPAMCDLWYGHFYGDKFGDAALPVKMNNVPHVLPNPGWRLKTWNKQQIQPYRRLTTWLKSEFLMSPIDRKGASNKMQGSLSTRRVGFGSFLEASSKDLQQDVKDMLGSKGTKDGVQNVCVLLRARDQVYFTTAGDVQKKDAAWTSKATKGTVLKPKWADGKGSGALQLALDFVKDPGGDTLKDGKVLVHMTSMGSAPPGKQPIINDDRKYYIEKEGNLIKFYGYLAYAELYNYKWCTHAFVGRGAASVLEPVALQGIPAFTSNAFDEYSSTERTANGNALIRARVQPKQKQGNTPTAENMRKYLQEFFQRDSVSGFITQAEKVKALIAKNEGLRGINGLAWLVGNIYSQLKNDRRTPEQKSGTNGMIEKRAISIASGVSTRVLPFLESNAFKTALTNLDDTTRKPYASKTIGAFSATAIETELLMKSEVEALKTS